VNSFAIPVLSLLLVACPAGLAASAPLSPEQAKILEGVRASALRYTQNLPDFMCTQLTRRTVSGTGDLSSSLTGMEGRSSHAGLPATMGSDPNSEDVIEERLTFIDHKENYTVVAVNGRKVAGIKHMQLQGAISVGEFGSDLHNTFAPASGTVFAWERPGTLHGHRVYNYSFRVPAQHGAVVVDRDSGRLVVAPYAGRVVVDAATLSVLRMKYRVQLPPGFPIRESEIAIEYKAIAIAGRNYVLPFRSELRMQDSSHQYVNTMDFRNYHKFTVESTILYGSQKPQ
jgi:hypothetical protein